MGGGRHRIYLFHHLQRKVFEIVTVIAGGVCEFERGLNSAFLLKQKLPKELKL